MLGLIRRRISPALVGFALQGRVVALLPRGFALRCCVDRCVDDQTYAGFVGQVNQEADQRQVTQTPTFMVNGQMVDTSSAKSWADMGNLVIAAVGKAK